MSIDPATIPHAPGDVSRDAARPLVPPISPDELARRNKAAMELLDSWMREGDEEEQRETMAALRKGLGEGRSGSTRPHFP